MIAYLQGKIIAKSGSYAIVQTGGVGYKVFLPVPALLRLKHDSEAAFFVHAYIREDQFSLYGFLTQEDLELFELLISVSGVGPKVAMGLLSQVSSDHIKSAIAGGEPAVFTKVSGVGRKTAERIIIELREKIGGAGEVISGKLSKALSDALDALVSLGYSAAEARDALKQVPAEQASTSDAIKAALKILANR